MCFNRHILLACFLVASAPALRADDTNLVLRLFPVDPSYLSGGEDVPSERPADIKGFYQKCGVTFPEGANITYSPKGGLLYHYNTEPNQKRFAKILADICPLPTQIQLDAVFVDFPLRDIEKLTRTHASPFPRSEDILQLWKSGKGTLLHALKLITQSGVNAQIQAVSEHIYVTEFTSPSSTNTASPLPVPSLFETREAGAIFNATPTFDRVNRTIQVIMAPELTAKPEWQSVSVTGTDERGKEIHLSVPQPLFHSRNITTSFLMTDGDTQVFGGMENPKGDGVTYLFLTATLLDATGQPLANSMGISPP